MRCFTEKIEQDNDDGIINVEDHLPSETALCDFLLGDLFYFYYKLVTIKGQFPL
jgi:hypothetical protein